MPQAPGDAIPVHSVQEEYFYMMVHACPCGGAWAGRSQQVENAGASLRHEVTARCARCGAEQTLRFELAAPGPGAAPPTAIREINPTDEPSRALDLVEWMQLGRFYLERIGRLRDLLERAQSLLDARQCLEEALKFYGPGDDGPPPRALWSDASRAKAAEQPALYSRAGLAAMLDRMPPMKELRKVDAPEQKAFEKAVRQEAEKRVGKWWQFWKRWRGG